MSKQRPDIKVKKSYIELMCPAEKDIEERHSEKMSS